MAAPGALQRVRLYLASVWAGCAVLVGVTAFFLNRTMTDRVAFGDTVSGLFRKEAWLGLACGLALVALLWIDKQLDARKRRVLLLIVGAMLACVLGYFAIQPMLAAMRAAAGPGGVMESAARQRFGMLHGVSMLFYLVQAVLGVVLVVKSRK